MHHVCACLCLKRSQHSGFAASFCNWDRPDFWLPLILLLVSLFRLPCAAVWQLVVGGFASPDCTMATAKVQETWMEVLALVEDDAETQTKVKVYLEGLG